MEEECLKFRHQPARVQDMTRGGCSAPGEQVTRRGSCCFLPGSRPSCRRLQRKWLLVSTRWSSSSPNRQLASPSTSCLTCCCNLRSSIMQFEYHLRIFFQSVVCFLYPYRHRKSVSLSTNTCLPREKKMRKNSLDQLKKRPEIKHKMP